MSGQYGRELVLRLLMAPAWARMTVRQLGRPIAVCGCMIVLLTACGASGVSGATTGGGTPSGTARPMPTSAVQANASLCALVSAQEFFAVVKGPVGSVDSNVGTVSGYKQVNCTYKPPNSPGAGGAITYLFTNDGAAYLARLQLGDQSVYNSENTVSGVGDAAFWGTQVDSPDAFELNMRKGNVIVNILMDGSANDGSVYLSGAEQIANEIASHL